MLRTVFILFLVVLNLQTFGQMSFVFNRFSRSDGLNTNNINCIWQDKKGFLWIGTENGIHRYDGRKFVSFFAEKEENRIPPFGVDQIMDAGNGKIWFRQGALLGMFDPVTFNYYHVPVDLQTRLSAQNNLQLFRDSRGNTFLCAARYGLLWYNPEQNKFTEENLPIKIPEGWPVTSLFEDTLTGDYWICSTKGLAVYHSTTGSLNFHGNNPGKIPFFESYNLSAVNNFFIDKNRTWWIFYWDFNAEAERAEIIHFDPANNKTLNDTLGLKSSFSGYSELNWIFETQGNQIWIGGINALLRHIPEEKSLVQYRNSSPGVYDIRCREIKQMFEDRENNLWLCTDNGLYIVTQEKSVLNYVFQNRTPGKDIMVNAILETNDLENWLGTWGNGVLTFDDHFVQTRHNMYNGVPQQQLLNLELVWDLCQHSLSGNIWSGCQNGNLAVFDPVNKKPVAFLEPPAFRKETVRQILEDKDGNLLFGTHGGRLIKWDKSSAIANESFEVIREFNTSIFVLFRDNANRIWVGTNNSGVFVLDPEGENVISQFKEKPFINSGPVGNYVTDIEQLNDSIFFVSTGFLDVININSGKVEVLTRYDGLPGGGVSQLLVDSEGILWFVNNNGLASYNYEKNIFIPYTERNGLIMADKSNLAKFKMKNGEFWFGGENLMFGFRPEGLKFKTAPPDVTLTDFKLFNNYISLDSLLTHEKVSLKPDQNTFSIYFSSLSFTQQDKLVYYYKMDGIDDDWIKAEVNPFVNYSSLSPGKYVFNVKCINMQGVESANITRLYIDISPHFYQTQWFMGLIILVAFGITYLFYRLRLNRLLAVERIRNKVARDLHDDVGSTLSTINILSSMAKTKLLTDPVKTSEYISKITHNSQNMMEAMDDIVWSIKPDNDNMQRIVARMREYASSILEPKDIEIEFSIDEKVEELKLNMESRRDLFLIFKEALNNSAKYSQCTQVKVYIGTENKKLLIRITDNGIGFNVQTADSGNGLGNMQKRAEALRGLLNIKSEEGKGTEVSLMIPVTF